MKRKCVVVITGCDSGFGNALSLELSQQGYHVISTCMTDNGMQSIQGRVAKVLLCDITSQDNVNVLANEVDGYLQSNRELRMWALINNAGIAPLGNMDWAKLSTYEESVQVDYIGAIRVTKAMLPFLKKTKYSRIINLASIVAVMGWPGFSPYCGSKHALEGAMKCLRMELRPWHIRVVDVNPSIMKTPIIDQCVNTYMDQYRQAPPELKQQYSEEALAQSANFLYQFQEDPSMVVKTISNLMVAYDPSFNNYVGVLAYLLRLWLMLPQSFRELFDFFTPPPISPKRDMVAKMQRTE